MNLEACQDATLGTLTDAAIRKAKPGEKPRRLTERGLQAATRAAVARGSPTTLGDGGGLVVEVRPTGVAWWRLRYWVGGREKRISLGTYPAVSLAEARRRRDEARALLASGTDPSEARKAGKAAQAKAREAGKVPPPWRPPTSEFAMNEFADAMAEAARKAVFRAAAEWRA